MNIKLHKHSEEVIKESFEGYVETSNFPHFLSGRTIIHMYHKSDTIAENGDFEGFIDSLFVELHIFNRDTMQVYKTTRLHDEIEINVPCRVRIFKDQSTVIAIDRPISISDFQSLEINDIKQPKTFLTENEFNDLFKTLKTYTQEEIEDILKNNEGDNNE